MNDTICAGSTPVRGDAQLENTIKTLSEKINYNHELVMRLVRLVQEPRPEKEPCEPEQAGLYRLSSMIDRELDRLQATNNTLEELHDELAGVLGQIKLI